MLLFTLLVQRVSEGNMVWSFSKERKGRACRVFLGDYSQRIAVGVGAWNLHNR